MPICAVSLHHCTRVVFCRHYLLSGTGIQPCKSDGERASSSSSNIYNPTCHSALRRKQEVCVCYFFIFSQEYCVVIIVLYKKIYKNPRLYDCIAVIIIYIYIIFNFSRSYQTRELEWSSGQRRSFVIW